MLGAVDNVGNDGACGRHLTGALAVEYDVAYCVAADKNGVKNIVHGGKLAVRPHECGRDHDGYSAVLKQLCPRNELDDSAP